MGKYDPVLMVGYVFGCHSVPVAGKNKYPDRGLEYRLTWTVDHLPITGPIWYFPPRYPNAHHKVKCYGCSWTHQLKVKSYLLRHATKHVCSERIDRPVMVVEQGGLRR